MCRQLATSIFEVTPNRAKMLLINPRPGMGFSPNVKFTWFDVTVILEECMFKDTKEVTSALGQQKYIASDEISTVLFLAEKLGKPVLAEGPAGVGKTELGKAWSNATGRKLIRLQCYEVLDESKALYEWEYAKQMLYTQLLRDKLQDMLGNASSLSEAADRLANEEDVFFSDRFLLPRPLLQAITSPEPALL